MKWFVDGEAKEYSGGRLTCVHILLYMHELVVATLTKPQQA